MVVGGYRHCWVLPSQSIPVSCAVSMVVVSFLVFVLSVPACDGVVTTMRTHPTTTTRALPPDKLIVGYSTKCGDGKVDKAIQDGVSVVIWSFWGVDRTCRIRSALNLTCVEQTRAAYPNVVHLASTGGWNGGHLEKNCSAEEIFMGWEQWANGVFDGLDWDLEGNDKVGSPLNHFSMSTLEKMGTMSKLAKQGKKTQVQHKIRIGSTMS